jgi:hypothetical protein
MAKRVGIGTGAFTMSIAWDDPVNFSWESTQLLVGRAMTLGSAVDYFAALSPAQKECARISLFSPVELSDGLPPAYELNGGKIDALVALRRAAHTKLVAPIEYGPWPTESPPISSPIL